MGFWLRRSFHRLNTVSDRLLEGLAVDKGWQRGAFKITIRQRRGSCADHSIKGYGALSFVEFARPQWAYNRAQKTTLMDRLRDEGSWRDLIPYVSLHGWKENAGFCDIKIECTREMLTQQIAKVVKLLSKNGTAGAQSKVVVKNSARRGLPATRPEFSTGFSSICHFRHLQQSIQGSFFP